MSVAEIVERLGGVTFLGCVVRTELELVIAVEAGSRTLPQVINGC